MEPAAHDAEHERSVILHQLDDGLLRTVADALEQIMKTLLVVAHSAGLKASWGDRRRNFINC
jgi:hypothetical protein